MQRHSMPSAAEHRRRFSSSPHFVRLAGLKSNAGLHLHHDPCAGTTPTAYPADCRSVPAPVMTRHEVRIPAHPSGVS